MEIINWKDEWSVGINEMDTQHRKLIEMINRLIAEEKVLTDPQTVAQLLTEMIDYAEVHFRAEEYLMAEYGYEQKTLQETQHQAFIEKTQAFCSAGDIGPNILSTALLDYLKSWLVSHILQEDMKYKEFFHSKNLS